LYENKGTFSSINFMEPLFNALQKELIERHADAAEESNLGFEEDRLAMLH